MKVVGVSGSPAVPAFLNTWQHIVCRKTHTSFELIVNQQVVHTISQPTGWPNALAKVRSISHFISNFLDPVSFISSRQVGNRF